MNKQKLNGKIVIERIKSLSLVILKTIVSMLKLNQKNQKLKTIPGFTEISMFPKLWQAIWLNNGELLEKLIELAK